MNFEKNWSLGVKISGEGGVLEMQLIEFDFKLQSAILYIGIYEESIPRPSAYKFQNKFK